MIKERNIKMTLLQRLNNLSRENLNLLADDYFIKGKSKLEKQQLIEVLNSEMKKEEHIKNLMIIIEDIKISMREKGEDVQSIKTKVNTMICLLGYGMISIVFPDIYYVVATDVIELIDNFDKSKISYEIERYHLIKKALMACLNLYGIYEISFFIELFNKVFHDKEPLTNIELSEFMKICRDTSVEGTIYKDCIISDYLLLERDIEDVFRERKRKEYYIPTKEQLMKL